MEKVDIIIPIYYAPGVTLRALESVVNTTKHSRYDVKIILVDDSTSDDFHELLKDFIDKKNLSTERLVLIKRGKNGGFIEACYTGVEYRDSDYKILLNSDTLVLGDWLNQMIETAKSDEKIALVSPITNNTPVINVEMPKGFNIHLMNEYLAQSKWSNFDYIDVVTVVGFCLLIKNKYLKAHGFFDRVFEKGYAEETDLQFRYMQQGLRAVISPKAFVYHRGEASFSDRDQRIAKNREVFFERHKEAYEKAFPEFIEKTILHDIRENILLYRRYDYDVIILAENNDLFEPSCYFAHRLANILNEAGVSTVVAVNKKYERRGQIEDWLFNSIEADELLMFNYSTKHIVSPPSLIDIALKLQIHSTREAEIHLLESYRVDSELDRENKQLFESLGVKKVSSITPKNVPFVGSLEYIGLYLKKHLKNDKPHKALILVDNQENVLLGDNFADYFGDSVTYIYTDATISEGVDNNNKKDSKFIGEDALVRLFASHDFLIDLRQNLYFSELHLDFILAGGYVVSENLILHDNIPNAIQEKIILPSEIPSIQNESYSYKLNEIREYTYADKILKFTNIFQQSIELNKEYYRTLLRIFDRIQAQKKNTIKYEETEVKPAKFVIPSLFPEPMLNMNRIRYRWVDNIIEEIYKIPYSYEILKIIVRILRKLRKLYIEIRTKL
jgi:GT2 family glycosyltransferase